ESLGLRHLLPKFEKPLGVRHLHEVSELEIADLEEIGLSRLEVRRLRAVAEQASTQESRWPRTEPPSSSGRQQYPQSATEEASRPSPSTAWALAGAGAGRP
ncbi:pol, partial [Symbiodinium natans]